MASSPAFASLPRLSRASAQRPRLGFRFVLIGLAAANACALETRPGDGLVSDGREIQVQPTVVDSGPPETGLPTGMGAMQATLCKNVPLFAQKVMPHYIADCVECHGGMKPLATKALTLTSLPMDPELACILTLTQGVTSDDPLQAEILTSSDPGRPDKVHDFKYEDPAAFVRYREDVLAWLRTEKMMAP